MNNFYLHQSLKLYTDVSPCFPANCLEITCMYLERTTATSLLRL